MNDITIFNEEQKHIINHVIVGEDIHTYSLEDLTACIYLHLASCTDNMLRPLLEDLHDTVMAMGEEQWIQIRRLLPFMVDTAE